MAIDLTLVPLPAVVEQPDYEAILSRMLADVTGRFQNAGIDYDVGNLETDPVKINLETVSYSETLIRARINDAVRRTLLYFAKGGDLDHLGAAHGVGRMAGEDDERFALRIILKNMDRNSVGSEPHYMRIAFDAHIRVRDAVVYTVERNPTIRVAILATDNNGVADAPLLTAVNAALQAPANRMVNDTIVVEPVVRQVIDVTADVWLLPDAQPSALALAEAALRSGWASDGKIGRDLSPSLIMRHLSVAGVQRIENLTPAQNIVVPFNEIAAIGDVNLTNKGRAY